MINAPALPAIAFLGALVVLFMRGDSPAFALRVPAGRIRRRSLAPVLDPAWPTSIADEHLRDSLRFAMWEDRFRRASMRWVDINTAGWQAIPARIRYTYRHRQRPLRGGDPTR